MKFAGDPLKHRLGFFSDLQYIFLSRVGVMVKFKEAASNECFAEELSEELPWKRLTFQKKNVEVFLEVFRKFLEQIILRLHLDSCFF